MSYDLDVAPEHTVGVAGPESFHRRFFRREAARVVNGGSAPLGAVRDLAAGEDALKEPIAVLFDGRGDPVDVGGVESKSDDVRHGGWATMILPDLNDRFEWRQGPAGPMLVCRPLEPFAPHIFTTRPWPLGSALPGAREACWNDVAAAIDVEAGQLLRIRQVHGVGVAVKRAGKPMVGGTAADIIVTNDQSVALAVRTADCVPLLVADARTGSVAASHAGWRGVALRVASVTVRALADEFGSRPSDLVAVVGPSIGPCCYEVGVDVRERFRAAGFSAAELARWFAGDRDVSPKNPSLTRGSSRARPNHWFLDIWAATRDQLVGAGVPVSQVHLVDLCTAGHPALFCSYRRDGSGVGRLAAAIRTRRARTEL